MRIIRPPLTDGQAQKNRHLGGFFFSPEQWLGVQVSCCVPLPVNPLYELARQNANPVILCKHWLYAHDKEAPYLTTAWAVK